MKYWSRIDLHQHTNHDIDCHGKYVKDNYNHLDYYKWLKEQSVNLKAVTCHNNVDIIEHVKQSIISDMLNINHLVGVEIDYRFEKVEFHAISILSPNVDVIKFSNKLNIMRTQKGNSIFFNKDDFCKLHEDIEFIFIPHAIKDKGLLDHELEKGTIDWVVKSLISGLGFPILFENTKDYYLYSMVEKIQRTLGISELPTEISAYTGSDYKFDNDELRKKKILERGCYSINSLPTYRGLEIALRNSDTRLSLDSQIINRERYIKSIKINKNACIKSGYINFSPGLNVIIGNSGTGKTLLLNQIFYELKNKGLTAAYKDNKVVDGKNPYEKKVGKNSLFEVEFDGEISKDDIKIIEIPNIYAEILKSQNDEVALIEKFGINNSNTANEILMSYKANINQYHSIINKLKIEKSDGDISFNNIKAAIDFIFKNPISKSLFNLKKEGFNENELKALIDKKNKIKQFIDDKEKVQKYFLDIKNVISNSVSKERIGSLLNIYDSIIKDLENELIIVNRRIILLSLEKRIIEIINMQIELSINMLGNREKTVKAREEVYVNETNKLINTIRNTILNELIENKFVVKLDYDKLKREIEKNANSYARLALNDDDYNITKTNLENSHLFNLKNNLTKIKGLNLRYYDLTDTASNKELIKKLDAIGIDLNQIVNDASEIPKNIELYLDEKNEWKLIDEINKGDIAKKSIEFYFNKLIKEQQPDIILIDQPENDVDKSFISDTLSRFIKTQKIEKQIIITSHDAIVAINADANMIIESSLDKNNIITYNSYCLEYVEEEKLIATNRVAVILDGGKNNIKKRYQIYGGELTYENRNY